MLYCYILYETIFYYTILYSTLLYSTLLYYTILYYTILYYTILYYTILYYTILYYTILYYTILYYTILYYTILYYTIPCSLGLTVALLAKTLPGPAPDGEADSCADMSHGANSLDGSLWLYLNRPEPFFLWGLHDFYMVFHIRKLQKGGFWLVQVGVNPSPINPMTRIWLFLSIGGPLHEYLCKSPSI